MKLKIVIDKQPHARACVNDDLLRLPWWGKISHPGRRLSSPGLAATSNKGGRKRKLSAARRASLEKATAAAHTPEANAKRAHVKKEKAAKSAAEDVKRGRLRSWSDINNGFTTGRGNYRSSKERKLESENKTLTAAVTSMSEQASRACDALARSRALALPSPLASLSSSSSLPKLSPVLRSLLSGWTKGELDRFDAFVYENHVTEERGVLTKKMMTSWVRTTLHKEVTEKQLTALLDYLDYEFEETSGERGYYFQRASAPATLDDAESHFCRTSDRRTGRHRRVAVAAR